MQVDVAVLGGGNAALCGAINAALAGCSVSAAGKRAQALSRRKLPTHTQFPLHASGAVAPLDGCLSRRRIFRRPDQSDQGQHGRNFGAQGHSRVRSLLAVDAAPRHPLSTVLERHAVAIPHQCVLSGWGQSAGERALPPGRALGVEVRYRDRSDPRRYAGRAGC